MSGKFENVPKDEETVVRFEVEAYLDDYELLYQKWSWDGITADSFIFLECDVAHLSDDELTLLVKESPLVEADSQLTLSRNSNGFTFVNFNFKSE
jgi:hypothetical protein